MSQLRVIEVITALVFMFYAAALLSSGLVEWLANLFKKRAKYLLRGIDALLKDRKATAELGSWQPTLVQASSISAEKTLYKNALQPAAPAQGAAAAPDDRNPQAKPTSADIMSHPLVRALAQSDADGQITRLPSYLSSKVFADSLLDILKVGRKSTLAEMTAAIDGLAEGDLKQALAALLKAHGDDVKEFTKAVEQWYDHAMDRVSGAYKRWSRRWLIVIAIMITAVMHLDAVGLAKELWSDETSRVALVNAIDEAPDCNEKTDAEEKATCIDEVVAALSVGGPPIGPQAWLDDGPDDPEQLMLLILGLLLTGSAAALGAPFWFDALGRLNSLRNTGPKPPKQSS